MADMDYFGGEYDEADSRGAGGRLWAAARGFGVMNWAGAVTSLGLAGVTAAWAVDIAFRDVTDVPVIRAMAGPMRVAPENPGGAEAPYQGLALSDITSGGPAAPAPERIVLAPPPLDLTAPPMAERAARVAQLEAEVAERPEEAAPAAPIAPTAPADPLAAAPDAPGVQVALLEAPRPEPADPTSDAIRDEMSVLIERLTAEAVGLEPPAPEPEPEPEAVDVASAKLTGIETVPGEMIAPPAKIAGIASAAEPLSDLSGRPAPRPAVWRPAEQKAVVTAASAPASEPAIGAADPSELAPGTRLVQLGAFDSEGIARAEWDRLAARFEPYMAGKQRLIQKASSGGRDFWRLRVVGFEGADDARRFCATLLAEQAACIPVTWR